MQLIDFTVPKDFELVPCSDVHVGLLQHHKEAFQEVLNDCYKKKNRYLFIGGDLAEGRPRDHKYNDPDTLTQDLRLPELQYEEFERLITPLARKKKIIAINEGNHDRFLSKNYGNRVYSICRRLGINFGTFVSIMSFKDKDGKLLFKFYYSHGSGTIRSSAGDIIRREANIEESLKRKLKNKSSDCLLMGMGHTHGLTICCPRTQLHIVSDGSRLQQIYSRRHGNSRIINPDDRWYINTGSFIKTSVPGITTYSEEAMYDPSEIGYPLVKVQNGDIVEIEKKPI